MITPGIITTAVVDAGPLFTVLTLDYVRHYHDDSALTKAGIPLEPEVQNSYLRLFEDIQTLLTTSHVVGELQGLQNSRLRLRDARLKLFWRKSMDYLKAKNLDERLICLLGMHERDRSREGVCIVGPSDMGLIELALQEGCVLLTDDEKTLAPLAWRHSVDCHLVRELVEPAR